MRFSSYFPSSEHALHVARACIEYKISKIISRERLGWKSILKCDDRINMFLVSKSKGAKMGLLCSSTS